MHPNPGSGSSQRPGINRRHLSLVQAVLPPDELARRLTTEPVTFNRRTWQIEVYSVVVEARCRWIQVGLVGPDRRAVLLQVPHAADETDTVAALENWVAAGSSGASACLVVPEPDAKIRFSIDL